jgi:hypothetical protein
MWSKILKIDSVGNNSQISWKPNGFADLLASTRGDRTGLYLMAIVSMTKDEKGMILSD